MADNRDLAAVQRVDESPAAFLDTLDPATRKRLSRYVTFLFIRAIATLEVIK